MLHVMQPEADRNQRRSSGQHGHVAGRNLRGPVDGRALNGRPISHERRAHSHQKQQCAKAVLHGNYHFDRRALSQARRAHEEAVAEAADQRKCGPKLARHELLICEQDLTV